MPELVVLAIRLLTLLRALPRVGVGRGTSASPCWHLRTSRAATAAPSLEGGGRQSPMDVLQLCADEAIRAGVSGNLRLAEVLNYSPAHPQRVQSAGSGSPARLELARQPMN